MYFDGCRCIFLHSSKPVLVDIRRINATCPDVSIALQTYFPSAGSTLHSYETWHTLTPSPPSLTVLSVIVPSSVRSLPSCRKWATMATLGTSTTTLRTTGSRPAPPLRHRRLCSKTSDQVVSRAPSHQTNRPLGRHFRPSCLSGSITTEEEASVSCHQLLEATLN